MGNSLVKEPLELNPTLESCRHLMQLLRSQDSNIQNFALTSLKAMTADPILSRMLMSGKDKISSPATSILYPAIVGLLHTMAMPPFNISLGLDILINLQGKLEQRSVKMMYEDTGLMKILDRIENCVHDFDVEMKVQKLKLGSSMKDNGTTPDSSQQSERKKWLNDTNGGGQCSREGRCFQSFQESKFKTQPALIEENIGKWVRIMTILEDFVCWGKLASTDIQLGKFTVIEVVQVIKRPIGRNWDYKHRKSLQIFFFDDCRTVEVVARETVDKMLAPWDDDDEDEKTRKEKDNLLTPWNKKSKHDENKSVVVSKLTENKMAPCDDEDEQMNTMPMEPF